MTGWRLGYAGGPQWLIAAMQILQSQSTSNPSAISQAAAVAALNHSADFLDGWLHTLDKRRQQVLGMIAATEGLSAGIPQGAFYVFANCQRLIGRVTPTGETLRDDSGLANWLLEHTQVVRVTRVRVRHAGVFTYCLRGGRWAADAGLSADCRSLRAAALGHASTTMAPCKKKTPRDVLVGVVECGRSVFSARQRNSAAISLRSRPVPLRQKFLAPAPSVGAKLRNASQSRK